MIRKKAEMYLGKLCSKEHKYNEQFKSLRYRLSDRCVDCRKLNGQSKSALAYDRKYKAENKKLLAERSLIYYYYNLDQCRLKNRTSEAKKKSDALRRAKKANSLVVPFTAVQWLMKCRDQFKWACAYCKCVLTHKTVTQDHIIPISLKGEHSLKNLVPACCSCNSSKHGANPITWCYEKFGYLPVWLESLVFEDWFAKEYLRIIKSDFSSSHQGGN